MDKPRAIIDFGRVSQDRQEEATSRFVSDLLCERHALWMRADLGDDGRTYAVTFNCHPLFPDADADIYLVDRSFLTDIARLYGGLLERIANDAPSAIQIAAEENLAKLQEIAGRNSQIVKTNIVTLKR